MKFVEHDRADRLEERIGQDLPGEDTLGQEPQAGFRGEPAFESDLVADLIAQAPALLVGDSRGCGPRGAG